MASGDILQESRIEIVLPSNLDGGRISLLPGESVVFVGANGSGKTRLAGWLDKSNVDRAMYIPARRSIEMPGSYKISNEDLGFSAIYAGASLPNQTISTQKNFRYTNHDKAFLANDFEHVLNILGARHASEAIRFSQAFDPKKPPKERSKSELDRAIAIWEACLPHLRIHSDKAPDILVERVPSGDVLFSPKDLSDGERAIFYLVAKAMIAVEGGVIIVDEPEMYIHRAIRNRLWDLIEGYRSDCCFVYFTHDVDFASTRVFREKYVVKSFRPGSKLNDNSLVNGQWEFLKFAADGQVPEDVQLAILGSRQAVLLIEGDGNSLDLEIARAFYRDFFIQPKGSCGDVIRGVTVLNANRQFHGKVLTGLIDRDSRSNEERSDLLKKKIYSHSVKEIENVIVAADVLAAVAENLGATKQLKKNLTELMARLQPRLKSKIDEKSFDLVRARVRDRLDVAILRSGDFTELAEALHFDVADQRREVRENLGAIVENGKLDEILSVFSVRKDGFGELVAKQFGFKDWSTYQATVLNWLKSPNSEAGKAIVSGMSSYLPSIPSNR